MRFLTTLILLLLGTGLLTAREPLYVVNGNIVTTIDDIPHEDIESIDVLPADEETIAKWGTEASEGVIIVTLRYDTPATFSHEGYTNYTSYLANHTKWSNNNPAERVSLRIAVDAQGVVTIDEVLDSTSRQFLKCVTRAISKAPRWSPAQRNGEPVPSIHLVNLKLPANKELPIEYGVILR